MTDEEIVFAAVAQEQIADLIQSGVLRWPIAEPYGSLLKAAQILHLRGQPITLLNLRSECPVAEADWKKVRDLWIEAKKQPAVHWLPAANRIIQNCMRRQGKLISDELSRLLEGSGDPRRSLVMATTNLSSLLDNGIVYNPTPSHHYHQGAMGAVVCSTGLQSLDSLLRGGLWSQALIGVALPSNHGKSTLAYTLIAGCVERQKKSVLFTFEASTGTAVAHVLSALTRLPLSETMAKKGSTPENQEAINEGLKHIDDYFCIYDLTFNDPNRMEQAIRLETPTLAIVDHLGMIDPRTALRNATRSDQIGDMADAALQWSIKYNATIVLNSQLSNSRQAELKKNHDLEHTEFFGSSRFYNALDFAIIGLRHWSMPNRAYFRLKKNRRDGILDIDATMAHNPSTQAFEELP